jgi:hypothetical protein
MKGLTHKFLYLVAGLIVLVLIVLAALSIWSTELTRFTFVPRGPLEVIAPLPANSYARPDMWISRPGMAKDPAQFLPTGAVRGARGRAYVFFVHPTSFLARNHWNAPLDDADSRYRADLFVRGMASPFGDAAGLYAPRYRQAAFGSFLVNQPESRRALDFAYGDVLRAFDVFIAQVPTDAPIVLAGHSQGANHVLRLLRERIKGTAIAPRIVAAYVVGWPISPSHDLPSLGMQACTAPAQAGCVMSWLSFAEPAEPGLLLQTYHAEPGFDGQPRGDGPVLCTNPLTGGGSPAAPATGNAGTFIPSDDLLTGKLTPGLVSARCDAKTGLLLIGEPPQIGAYVLPGNNYHIYDLLLFWGNVRADVARREAAWFAARQDAPAKAR